VLHVVRRVGYALAKRLTVIAFGMFLFVSVQLKVGQRFIAQDFLYYRVINQGFLYVHIRLPLLLRN